MICALICSVCVQQAWDELFDEHAEPAAAAKVEEVSSEEEAPEVKEVSPERFGLRDRIENMIVKRQRTQ